MNEVPGFGAYEQGLLRAFARLVRDFFETDVWLVGSALKGKEFRDVDVRVILDEDAHGCGWGPANVKWSALTLAFSALGRQMTGLPIDFQIQPRLGARAWYGGEPKYPLA